MNCSAGIAQLAVIGYLFVGVARRSNERTMSALERTQAALQSRRMPGRGGWNDLAEVHVDADPR